MLINTCQLNNCAHKSNFQINVYNMSHKDNAIILKCIPITKSVEIYAIAKWLYMYEFTICMKDITLLLI